MVASIHETQSKRKNKRGLPDHLWVLQRALEGRSGRTEFSKGAQGRIIHQRPEHRGALNKPTLHALLRPKQAAQKSQEVSLQIAMALLDSCKTLLLACKIIGGNSQPIIRSCLVEQPI